MNLLEAHWNHFHIEYRIYLKDKCFSQHQIRSDQISRSVVSDSFWPHGLQHARLPYPSPTPAACLCPLSRWCHPTISSSVVPFPSCLQSFPASGSFPMNWFFTSGDQSIGASASASVLPVNIQGWFLLGLTGLVSLLSKGLSRVFSSYAKPLWIYWKLTEITSI